MLSGFSRGTWLTLENAKAKIENYFNKVYGKTVMVDDGSAVAVFYGNALIVPTGDEELKKIQINRLRLLDGFPSSHPPLWERPASVRRFHPDTVQS